MKGSPELPAAPAAPPVARYLRPLLLAMRSRLVSEDSSGTLLCFLFCLKLLPRLCACEAGEGARLLVLRPGLCNDLWRVL